MGLKVKINKRSNFSTFICSEGDIVPLQCNLEEREYWDLYDSSTPSPPHRILGRITMGTPVLKVPPAKLLALVLQRASR